MQPDKIDLKEQNRKPRIKSNALVEGGFCASKLQKIVICQLVPKMQKADWKRDFSNVVIRVQLITRELWLDKRLANHPSDKWRTTGEKRETGDRIKEHSSQKVTQWGETGERIVRQGQKEVGNSVEGTKKEANERGTSACSVIQGCWLLRRKEGAVLMEDRHVDKVCSYRDTKTRRQQATKLQLGNWLHAPPHWTAQPLLWWFRTLHLIKPCWKR